MLGSQRLGIGVDQGAELAEGFNQPLPAFLHQPTNGIVQVPNDRRVTLAALFEVHP